MDDLKISFYDEREINVYKDKGVVVCRMVGVFEDEEIVGYGTARCKGGDTFDEEKGVRIATALAENKIYHQALHMARHARLVCREQEKVFKDYANTYTRFIEKGERTLNHNWDYITRVDNGEVKARKNK